MDLKEIAAVSAVKLVKDGQIVGLGTGATMRYALKEIARRMYEDELEILCIPSSFDTQFLAVESGIPLTTLEEHQSIDIALDGADEVDGDLNLIKGGGAAHTREKIIARHARKFIVIVDESKVKTKLSMRVPVEVLPFAWKVVEKDLRKLRGTSVLRTAANKAGPVITDNGNFILDVDFGKIRNPKKLEEEINAIAGVVENGIFAGMASEVHVGTKKGVIIKRCTSSE